MPETFYEIEDERGVTYGTWETERAARLARAGLTVTATTVGGKPDEVR